MPAKDSWGGPIASEPPFVEALRELDADIAEEEYVFGDRARPTAFHKRIYRVWTTAIHFRRLLAKNEFDLVHLNTAFDLRTILRDSFSIFLMRPGKTKVFLKIHGSEAEKYEYANFLIKSLIAYLRRHVDGLGVHTREECNAFIKLGFPEAKIFFVKNAVTFAEHLTASFTRRAKTRSDRWDLLFVSRFIPAKGLMETIRACSLLRQEGIDFRLYCVGDGEIRQEAENEARALGLSDTVDFTGYIPEAEIGRAHV